jgi:ferrous iron transport protein A
MQLITSAAQMRPGQTGVVVGLRGGRRMTARLDAMGIRPGLPISRQIGQPFRGPIVVRVGGMQLALGFGIAQRIMVRVGR